MTFLVNINESPHAVNDDQLKHVESQILAAVHIGGAFIDFRRMSGRMLRILITPASIIQIERLPSPIESPDDGDEPDDSWDRALFELNP